MNETKVFGASKPVPRAGATGLAFAGLVVVLSTLHGCLIWAGMEGARGLTNGWPLWRDDHPLYYHSALVTRHFLARTWTTAGYDPAFMAGYAKSVVFPASSTLPELVVTLFGGRRPELAYKLYVLVSAAAVPWLVAAAARLWGAGSGGTFVAVALYLLYVWTDFPLLYVEVGMLPYFLAVPLGLVASGTFVRYAERGGLAWWAASAALMSFVLLVHLTLAMIVVPVALVVYATTGLFPGRPQSTSPDAERSAVIGPDDNATTEGVREDVAAYSPSRHVGVWLIPVVVLLVNSFWWLPGVWLASTKGASDFAFAHPEGAAVRLWQVVTTEPPVERLLIVLGVLGALALVRRGRTPALGLAAFVGAGFFWGYLSGAFRSLDFLQPGRHTYAFYTGLSVAAGPGVSQGLCRLRKRSCFRLDAAASLALAGAGVWFFGWDVLATVGTKTGGPVPFLSSRPSPWLLWVVSQVRRHVRPGDRLLYEEGGFELEGIPDPFQGGRFSAILADRLGVELIGGPYLHAALTTNFTQFGEGKLFGRADWDRAWFVRYARLYRPAAILCWSPGARRFCRENPDLVLVKRETDGVLIGRVLGFGGAAIEGKAEVEAGPNRLRVKRAEGGVDGSVVLRYHSVPCLRTDPPVAWDSVRLEDDPVPFIRLRPPLGDVVIELSFPPTPSRGTRR